MERKTVQIDLNTHNWLIKFCKEKNYNVGGWVAQTIRDAMYLEKYGKKPNKNKTKKQ